MRRRSLTSTSDSLELLLDTICNTFGAVLFISILVVTLIKPTSSSAPETTPEDFAELEAELVRTKALVEQLDREAKQQRRVTARFSSDMASELAQQVHSALADQTELTTNRIATAEALRQLAQDNAAARRRIRQRREDLKSATEDAAQTAARLKEARAARSRAAQIPRIQKTSKLPMSFFLTGGRLYQVNDTQGNLVDCEYAREGQFRVIVPKSGAGHAVTNSSDHARVFKTIDANRHFVQLWVWADSFEQFSNIKETIVAAGLRYEVRVVEVGVTIKETSAPRTDSFVQ